MRELTKRSRIGNLPGAVSDTNGEVGVIKVHENVIAAIVRNATCSVDGVVRLAGSSLVDSIAEMIGNRKMTDRAIHVDIREDAVAIEVEVNIAYGAHIPTVAANIQSAVVEEVQKLTSMKVTRVNVIVQELTLLDKDTGEEQDRL